MKTKQASKILAIALSTAALAVYGCGGSSSSGSGATSTTSGTTITGATQAGSASGAGTQTAGVGSNSGQTLSNLAAVGGSCPGCAPQYKSPLAGKDKRFNKLHAAEVKAMKVPQMKKAAFLKKAKALASAKKAPVAFTTITDTCTDGGTYSISGAIDDVTFAYTMTMTFVNCRDMDTESNGTITNSGTFSATTGGDTFTMKLGDGDGDLKTETADTDGDGVVDSVFRVREFTDNYTNLFAAYTADMIMSGSGDPTLNATTGDVTGYTFTYTGNGKEEYTDFIDTYTFALTNLIFSSTGSFAAVASSTTPDSGSDTINGTFSESWIEGTTANSVAITFGDADTTAEVTTNTSPDFTIAWETDWTTFDKFSVDGQVAMDYTTPSDADCFDGTFLIDTTTPINENLSTGLTTAGVMTINTNTTVTFNTDGTVTVTVNGTPTAYASQDALETVCPIEDMEEDTAETNSTGTGSTSGATNMLITLSWDTDATDMDLHLNYYNTTTPTSTTSGTWYMDWHHTLQGSGGVDVDLPADGVGDVDLDYDTTTGYGPEHITAGKLPAGYYVVSVNNFSNTGSTVVTVTVNVGGTLFTFPTHTFTTSGDGEVGGSLNSASWHRVCDITVAANGTATIIAPNTTLEPWHDGGGFNMPAPKRTKAIR